LLITNRVKAVFEWGNRDKNLDEVHMNNVPNGKTSRAFLKRTAAVLAVPLLLTTRKSAAQTPPLVSPPSPPTTPWQDLLPNAITRLDPVNTLTPSPTEALNLAAGEAGRASHQRFSELRGLGSGTTPLYEMTVKENPYWVFNQAYPPQLIWGFAGNTPDATAPGPTIFARYGQPISCRIHNQLPYDHIGFGTLEITTHLHNLHTPSESDGFPGDYFGPHPDQKGPTLSESGEFLDHFYPNILAGYDEFGGIGDPREALGTLWYQDHTVDFTAPNVYRGMAGFYLIFDDIDSGNEYDLNPSALRLPSYPYDYPLIFQDKRFDANKRLVFDQFTPEGVPGDKVTVNGKWVFSRRNGMWAVNDQFFDVFSSRAVMAKGSAEVWELVNPDNGWSHPIHIHFEEGLILSRARDGLPVPVPPHERGRKDVYVLGPAESMKVLLRFHDFTGKYPMHCHNLVHEDYAMMIRWDIVS
jgi:hypothetical protein